MGRMADDTAVAPDAAQMIMHRVEALLDFRMALQTLFDGYPLVFPVMAFPAPLGKRLMQVFTNQRGPAAAVGVVAGLTGANPNGKTLVYLLVTSLERKIESAIFFEYSSNSSG